MFGSFFLSCIFPPQEHKQRRCESVSEQLRWLLMCVEWEERDGRGSALSHLDDGPAMFSQTGQMLRLLQASQGSGEALEHRRGPSERQARPLIPTELQVLRQHLQRILQQQTGGDVCHMSLNY